MPRKLERWQTEVKKEIKEDFDHYKKLGDRELVIVGCNTMDLALVELIEKRLIQHPKELESFLGLNEDGRAPAGSFGARIQLALLLGLIYPAEADALRALKKIRNRFAHRYNVTLGEQANNSALNELRQWLTQMSERWDGQFLDLRERLRRQIAPTSKNAERNTIHYSFVIFNALFGNKLKAVTGLTQITTPDDTDFE